MTAADEILQAFLGETAEALEHLAADVLALEHAPEAPEPLARVLRSLHTVKGSSASLAYGGLERLAHVAEGLVCRLRDSRLPVTPAVTEALLAVVDAVSRDVDHIASTGSEGPDDHAALVARLTDLLEPPERRSTDGRPPRDVALVIPSPLRPTATAPAPLGRMLVDGGAARPDDVTLAVMEQREGDPRPLGEILVGHGATTPGHVQDALERQAEGARSSAARSVRVDPHVVDALLAAVARLDQVRADVAALTGAPSQAHADVVRRLDALTDELVGGVTALRRQPIDTLASSLARVVRDVGVTCGKRVRLELEGQATSLDRGVLEALKDPLVQCVRNAVDHGIEAVDARVAADKPVVGRVLLRAWVQATEVVLELSDDGAGVDVRRVASRAQELGLRTAEQLAAMSEDEVVQLVLLPGLSTAPSVTRVSGRGIGMDVARTNVEALGGRIDVSSTPGRGTTVRLTVPSSPGCP